MNIDLHDSVSSSLPATRRKWRKMKKPRNENGDATCNIIQKIGQEASVESNINTSSNLGMLEIQPHSNLNSSQNEENRIGQFKEKKGNAPKIDNASINFEQVGSHTNNAPSGTEISVEMCTKAFAETASCEAKVLSETTPKKKKRRKQPKRKCNDPKTDNMSIDLPQVGCQTNDAPVRIEVPVESSTKGFSEAGSHEAKPLTGRSLKKRKRKTKKDNAPKTDETIIDLPSVSSKTNNALLGTEVLVDTSSKAFLETASLEEKALSNTSPKMELVTAVIGEASNGLSTEMDPGKKLTQSQKKNLRKKKRKLLVDTSSKSFLETASPEVKALSNMSPKMELVTAVIGEASNGLSTEMDPGKQLTQSQKKKLRKERQKALVDTSSKAFLETASPEEKALSNTSLKTELVTAVIGEASNGLSTDMDPGKKLTQSQKKNLRKKRQKALVDTNSKAFLETASPEEKALSNTSSKTELVTAVIGEASNGLSTEMDPGKKLTKSQKKNLRKKRQKALFNALGHDIKSRIFQEEVSKKKDMFLEKDSVLQPPINSCLNSAVIKQSSAGISFPLEQNKSKEHIDGHKGPQNNSVADCQMSKWNHFKRQDVKFASEASNLSTVVEDHMDCNKADGVGHMSLDHTQKAYGLSASKSDRVLAEGIAASLLCPVDIVMNEASVNSTGGVPVGKDIENIMKVRDSKEDIGGDTLMGHVPVSSKPERQVEQKNLDEENFQISVLQASHVQNNCDQSPANNQEKTSGDISGHDTLCKHPSLERVCINRSKKKLLVLDLNGILADIVPCAAAGYKPHIRISSKAVFKRPYCDDFLRFCFEKFNVGVWSSRKRENVERVIKYLLGGNRDRLLFCWNAEQCTKTGLTTMENTSKPLVLKELRKLWDKLEHDLPWEKGEYDETNTVLLDDSPYKAVRNPAHTGIFPYSYKYRNARDFSLGRHGDLRLHLERLAAAENVQEYIRQNPFGQQAITETSPSWGFYSNLVITANSCQTHDKHENHASICHNPISSDSFKRKDALGDASGEACSSGKLEKEDKERSASSAPITETSPSWGFRSKLMITANSCQTHDEHENHASICHSPKISSDSFKRKDALGDASGEAYSSGKLEKEDKERSASSAPSSHKVDKFGTLVRQGASDGGSDGPHYNGRHRLRDRSRSRSPRDRWRSPRRRREERGRSRSWSPRNHRSRSRSPRHRSRSRSPRHRRNRSRSPGTRRVRDFGGDFMRSTRHVGEFGGDFMRSTWRVGEFGGDFTRRNRGQIPDCFHFRRGGCFRGASCQYMHHDFGRSYGSRSFEFGGDSMRRNRGQIPDCFQFRRGQCFRGASCRYMHHDFDRSDGSRSHRSKQQYSESAALSQNSNIHVEIKQNIHKESGQEHGKDTVNTAPQSSRFKDGTLADSCTIESASSREVFVKELETQVLPEKTAVTTTAADKSKSLGVGSQDLLPSEDSMSKNSASNGPLLGLLHPARCWS